MSTQRNDPEVEGGGKVGEHEEVRIRDFRNPRTGGRSYTQLQEFMLLANNGRRVIYHSPHYVLMSRSIYDDLLKPHGIEKFTIDGIDEVGYE